ncbi:MAG: flippase-like domain-containing protein [Methylococcaceae bacterium]|nr:flippase-like domain-containing protein [Methylococcaceae bacterium]
MNGPRPERKPAIADLYELLHSFGIRFAASIALIGVLGNRLDLEKVFRALQGFDESAGLAMFGVNILLIFVFAKRWQVIASGLDFDLPYLQLVRAIWLASFLGQFGPTLVIAEATRFQLFKKKTSVPKLIASQVLDRLSGQIVLFMLVLLLFPYYLAQLDAKWQKLLWVIPGAILFAAFILHFLDRRILSLPHSDRAIELLGRRGLPGHYGLSLIIQILLVLNFGLAAMGLGIRDQLLPMLLMVPLLFAAITLLPIAISDWGSRESAAAILLSSGALDAETVVSISVLYGLIHLLAALPGGLFLMHSRLRDSRQTSYDKPEARG